MTYLGDLLLPATVLADVPAGNKKALFQQLSAVLADHHALDARAIADSLANRERLGSTGFGGGVAIPHGRLAGLDKITGLFARLAQPVDFQAVDDLPVDLVFVLLSPPEAGAEHLKALARVSRALRDQPFLAKLRGAGSRDALYALLATDDPRAAA